MRSFNNNGVKALLLAGCAGTFVFAAPAMAQDSEDGAEEGRIVVTGSRIQQRDFDSNSPIITIDSALLEQSSTAAIESNLNKLPQFTPAKTPTQGGDIQPTATNTPGAATVSLRGIGSNRNLVLLDGRRATPGNATGVVDITTIPSAAIERVEIISGGASATYGADAVAGVTNFILKKNFEGLELDAQAGITQEGDGFEYQISGIMGTDFADGRGNISLAMSVNTREANFQKDRSWYQDIWQDTSTSTGAQFFTQFAGIDFNDPFNAPDYSLIFDEPLFYNPGFGGGLTIFTDQNGNAFVNEGFTDVPAQGTGATVYGVPFAFYPNYQGYTGPVDGTQFEELDTGLLSQNNVRNYLVLPLTRYNAFARGNYEINDNIGVFAQAMFSKVSTRTIQEPGPIFAGWGVLVDPTGLDRDQLPDDMWTLLDSRPDADAPFTVQALLPAPRETFTDVQTMSLLAGFEGSVPGTDWTWEAFVNHGESSTFALQTGIYSLERVRAVLDSGNFGEGFSATGNQGAPGFGFGASTATCTSGLNPYIQPAGGYSQDCLEAIRSDLKNRSTIRQTIAEANVQGGLFDLPAGTLRFAVGASFREMAYEFLNDTLTTQGTSFLDQALGIYPSGNVDEGYDVHELYGELLVPVLADIPFIQELNLELGGRISDYSTTGVSYTYKILGDWQVNDWIRFRGGYNRAERSPNIAELYLAPSQTFGVNTAGDPCSLANPLSFSANPANANGANVQAICRILMEQSGDVTADEQYYSGVQSNSTFGFAFPTVIGNAALTPEKADTWTAGLVLQPNFGGAINRARLTIDWYSIKVSDAIGAQSVATVLQQCFDANLNPLAATNVTAAANSALCQVVPRNGNGGLGNVLSTYVNDGRFKTSGIDVSADLGFDVGPGSLNLNVVANYLLEFKSASLPSLPLVDYVGTFGTTENGLNEGAYEYRVLTTVGYSVGPASVSLQWQHLPAVNDAGLARFGGTSVAKTSSYNLFNLNSYFTVTDTVQMRFGVDNLFNTAPPISGRNPTANPATGNLPGGTYQSNFYDTIGRRFYVGANFKF